MTIRDWINAQVQVQRINNPAPSDGPELYEVRDEEGNIIHQSEDERGAEKVRDKIQRKKLKLGHRPKPVKEAAKFKDGEDYPNDDRLRRTTSGSGPGGPTNG